MLIGITLFLVAQIKSHCYLRKKQSLIKNPGARNMYRIKNNIKTPIKTRILILILIFTCVDDNFVEN